MLVRLYGSGLDAATVDRARQTIEGNRAPRKVGDRFFQLAGGLLRCAHCGLRLIGYARCHPGRAPNFYYRCDSPSRAGSMCSNRRSREACELEYEAARLFERTASEGALLELFDKAVAEHISRNQLHNNLERQAALAGMLSELEEERRGYLRQNARGVVSDADLDVMLAEVETRREAVASEMRRAEDATAKACSIQATRHLLFHEEWYEDLDSLTPRDWPLHIAREEELRAAYIRYGARFEAGKDGGLVLRLELDLDRRKEEYVANGSQGHGNEH